MKKGLWILIVIFIVQILSFASDDNEIDTNSNSREEENQNEQISNIENENIDSWNELNFLNIGEENKTEFRLNMISGIWELNVYKIFYINKNKYNTPLKKRVFEKSQKYIELVEKLKKLKNKIKEMEFFFQIKLKSDYESNMHSAYNINTKKFELLINGRYINNQPKNIFYPDGSSYGISLKLPLSKVEKNFQNFLYYRFEIDEAAALKIENNGVVKIFFKIIDIEKVLNQYELKRYIIITNNNRIEISDKTNGDILFNKKIPDIPFKNFMEADKIFKKFLNSRNIEIQKKLLKEISILVPEDEIEFIAKGILNFYKKNYNQSIKYLSNALDIEKSVLAYNYRSLAYEKIKNYKKAIKDITNAIELSDKNNFQVRIPLFKNRANLYNKIGKNELALKDMKSFKILESKINTIKVLRSIRPATHIRSLKGKFKLNLQMCAKYMGHAYNEVGGAVMFLNLLFKEISFVTSNTLIIGRLIYPYKIKNGILHTQIFDSNNSDFIIRDYNTLIGKDTGIVYTRIR